MHFWRVYLRLVLVQEVRRALEKLGNSPSRRHRPFPSSVLITGSTFKLYFFTKRGKKKRKKKGLECTSTAAEESKESIQFLNSPIHMSINKPQI